MRNYGIFVAQIYDYRSSIAFEDFLGSCIAPQVMPPCMRIIYLILASLHSSFFHPCFPANAKVPVENVWTVFALETPSQNGKKTTKTFVVGKCPEPQAKGHLFLICHFEKLVGRPGFMAPWKRIFIGLDSFPCPTWTNWYVEENQKTNQRVGHLSLWSLYYICWVTSTLGYLLVNFCLLIRPDSINLEQESILFEFPMKHHE